ncbi:MAG: hypothetical protein IPJ74_08565 [Saprospiraceae bacterium]|nr:hypothetical protein [Saprospiraceae bacterium]
MDKQFVNYEYDSLMRLKKASARKDSVITEYFYQFQGTGNPNNYVRTKTTFSDVNFSDLIERNTFQYIDGLARPIQTVEKAYSEDDKDIVKALVYDKQGRPYKQYDPFESAGTTGAFVSSIPSTADSTITKFEASPLNRVDSVTPPSWYATTTAYGNNTGSITAAGITYPAGSLMTTTVTDPNGNLSIEFKDKKGRVVLVRRDSVGIANESDTEFLFDNKDRISKVVPPGATLSHPELIYTYLYDERDRVIEKKIADQAKMLYKYNERNLPTLMQDGNMNAQNKWLLTKYDIYGRATGTGFLDGTVSDGNDATKNFTEPLTVNIYDGSLPIELGKLKTSKVKILGTQSDWLQTTFMYDPYGRIQQSESNHHLYLSNFQSDVVSYTYDFADHVTTETRVHKKDASASNLTVYKEMVYDHVGRMTGNYHQVNGGTKVQLSELHYTPKDQISEKNLGKVGSSFLQSLDYTYLPNGFLSAINSASLGGGTLAMPTCSDTLPNPTSSGTLDNNDLFYMALKYDNTDGSSIGAQDQKTATSVRLSGGYAGASDRPMDSNTTC